MNIQYLFDIIVGDGAAFVIAVATVAAIAAAIVTIAGAAATAAAAAATAAAAGRPRETRCTQSADPGIGRRARETTGDQINAKRGSSN